MENQEFRTPTVAFLKKMYPDASPKDIKKKMLTNSKLIILLITNQIFTREREYKGKRERKTKERKNGPNKPT